MDGMNAKRLDQQLEDAFRTEPLATAPSDITRLVMKQIQAEQIGAFQLFSLLNVILSFAAALTFGIMISVPLLLPQQIRPWIGWGVQWIAYAVEKSMVSWPLYVMLFGGLLLVGLLLFVLRKDVFSCVDLLYKLQRQEKVP
jgi:hypothetical protein